jgi:hypothetical protein
MFFFKSADGKIEEVASSIGSANKISAKSLEGGGGSVGRTYSLDWRRTYTPVVRQGINHGIEFSVLLTLPSGASRAHPHLSSPQCSNLDSRIKHALILLPKTFASVHLGWYWHWFEFEIEIKFTHIHIDIYSCWANGRQASGHVPRSVCMFCPSFLAKSPLGELFSPEYLAKLV